MSTDLSGISGGQIEYKPNNYGNATNFGFEFVFSRYFGSFGVLGNYTFTHSAITTLKKYNNLQTGVTEDRNQTRSLQGQSDHIANLSLLYRNPNNGLFLQLAYQYIGKTLKVVNSIYDTDYYQKPQSLLALSGDKTLGKHCVVFIKLNNLLNTPYLLRVGSDNLIVQRDTYKTNYSIGLRYAL